jgi:CelD/BcsL family acetyltransferase involved in cellulose biosynthesis
MDAAMRRSLLRSQLASAELHDYGAALFAAAGRFDAAERMRQRAEACRLRARIHVAALDLERNAEGSMRRPRDLADK